MNRSELTEANSQSGREDAPSGRQPIDTAPRDGTPIFVHAPPPVYRFHPYSPRSPQFKSGRKGRWQKHTGYGFENCEPPVWDWSPIDGGAGVPVHAPAETATGSEQDLILSLTKEVEGLREAVKPLADAAEAYIRTHGNFRVRGETEAERRFSKGEQDETAMEAAFDVLHELSFDDLYRALSTSGRAE